MKEADLAIQLSEGEGTTLEYKENLSGSFARELVALANTRGGRILLGVRDDGAMVGIRDTNKLRARIQDTARNCDPPVQIRLETVSRVVVVHVLEGERKPIQCSDGFFWRQGAATQKHSRDELRECFRKESAVRFDNAVHYRFRYPQDDAAKFAGWLAKSRVAHDARIEDVLINIEAADRHGRRLRFRNAGVLFFAGDARRFFTQAYVTYLLFRGTDRVHVLDRKDFAGGLPPTSKPR